MPRKFTPHAPEVIRGLQSISIEYWAKLPGTISGAIVPDDLVPREKPTSIRFRFVGTDGKEHLIDLYDETLEKSGLKPVLEQLLDYAHTVPFSDALPDTEEFIEDVEPTPFPTTPAPDVVAPK